MKFTIEPKQLRAALNVANAARSQKGVLPILNNVLITATDDRIAVCGTDMDCWFESSVAAQVSENGEGLISGDLLSGLADKITAPITLSVDDTDKKGLLVSGKSKYQLGYTPSLDFPVSLKVDGGLSFVMNGKRLAEAVRLTYFAADLAKKSGSAELSSILLDLQGNTATFVSTNKHRLSYQQCAHDANLDPMRIMAAATTWNKIAAAMADVDVTVTYSDSFLQVNVADTIMVSRLMNGSFPRYEKVIPKTEHHIKINRAEMLAALQRLRLLFDKDDDSKVIMTLNAEGAKLEAQSESDIAVEIVACEVKQELRTAFQINYITEVLGIMDAETIDLGYTGPLNPMLFTADSMDGFQYVGMPRQVGA